MARSYVIVDPTVFGRYGGNSYYIMAMAIDVAMGRLGGKIVVGNGIGG